MKLAGRGWRIFATGLAFATFGLVALLLSLTLFPLLAVTAADVDRAARRVQAAVHYGCRWFIWFMKTLGLITYELHGREHLKVPGRLIIANHPSLIDVVFLFAWLPQLDCIVKQELWRNPYLRRAVGWAGYIGNATPEGLVESCAASLRAGRTLVVFPEGTRSTPGQALRLQRGAARIALQSGVEVVPVQIRCEPITLTKGLKWYQVPERTPHYRFTALPPLRADRYQLEGEPQGHAARRLTAHFETVLTAELVPAAEAVPVYSLQAK
jgi:1-acyl-sn-glycerol-3-phosphate acyltransferase